MASAPHVREGSSFPPGGDGRAVVLYESGRTRVFRVGLAEGAGTAVCKEALGPSSMARTRHEIAMLKRLVGVRGVIRPLPDPAGDVHTIVFGDVGGRSLADVLRSGRLDPAGLPRLALALARIIVGVHRAGVMHRDVNPANILVRGQVEPLAAEPLLIDFDLATTFAEVRPGFTHHREIVGRLAYLAPEQTGRTGLPVDLRADLYGLGATLYELATGAPPFGDGDPLRLVRDILARVPRPLTEVVAGVSPGLSDVVARLLEKEPQRRYQSAEGLAHDLAKLCEDPSVALRLGDRDFPSRLVPPSALVGRDVELDALRAALDKALDTEARGVLVTGAPGVGKSALIEQLRPMVTARGGWYVAGKFDQYRHDTAPGAVVQALARLGRLLLAEPEAELAGQRERMLEALGPNAGLVTASVPEFAALLGTDHPVVEGDLTETEVRLRQAQVDLLRAVASRGRPIVMVLDDLQWADRATLAVIDGMQTDDRMRGLLMVGAYRDGEVDAAHPLTAALSRWARLGAAPSLLRLDNLVTADLGELLAGMLRLSGGPAAALAAAVGERTGGNPYDTVALVNALRRDGALVLGSAGWSWDPSTIRHYIGQGDVVDLLKHRIDRLPTQARHLLEIMACLGGTVRLDLLAAASDHSRTVVLDVLAPALEDALLVMDSGDRADWTGPGPGSVVRFGHDRVQQAAYDGLDGVARSGLHLAIARRLARAADLHVVAAEQYLAAVDQLVEPAERRHAAELFAVAAAGASRVSNHATAERYLAAASGLWDGLGVAPDDAALIGLETAWHAALYNLGRLDEADVVYGSIERRCADPLDLVEAACLQVASLTNRNRSPDAVAFGFGMLGRLGYTVPGEDIRAQVQQRLDGVNAWIDRASVAEDVRRPEVTDPRALAGARLIRRMAPPALFSDQTTLLWLFIEAQRLWEEYGPCDALVPTIGMGGFSLIWICQDYALAARIQRHGLAVGAARGYEIETAQARYLYACTAGHWFEPVEEDVRQARIAREGLIRGGDLQSACFSFNPSVQALLDCGPTLDDLASEVEAALGLCARTSNYTTAANILVYRQFDRAMRGETAAPGSFADASFDEEAHLRVNPRARTYAHINRALSAAIFGDTAGLVRHAAEALRMAPLLTGLYPSAVARVVGALALAHQAREAAPQERPDLLAELDHCRDWLALRAKDAPENFGHLLRLVEAERAWAAGDFRAAVITYDAALREAEARQRPWHRALITERAGLFHLGHGAEHIGRWLIAEARLRYEEWGATGKVRELDRVHPFLRHSGGTADDRPRPDHTHSGGVSSDDIDMLAILRASQALSSETSLNRLYASAADQMRTITGATTVQLLLVDEAQGWVLPATAGEPGATVAVAAARDLLPMTAFRYVERTRRPLLVEDATRDDRFARDPYLAGVERCSLLVVPIIKQRVMRAVLLLENRLSSGAFSADRLDAVLLIAGQLAVSLDNALLYRRLEDKVAERTRALQAANEQLETLSLTDPLTGLANRRCFDDVLAAAWRNAFATGTSIAVAMIDIDHFKWYNDKHGHLAGDACLKEVAAILAASIQPDTDLACRYGGEEFALIFPGADNTSAAASAEQARQAVAALTQPHDPAAGIVTLSIGIAATVPTAERAPDALINAADTALYHAKQHGRNQVWIADDQLDRH